MVSEKVSPLEVKNEQKSKKKKSKKKNQSGKNKYTSNNTVSKDESFDYGENRINLNNYGNNLNAQYEPRNKRLKSIDQNSKQRNDINFKFPGALKIEDKEENEGYESEEQDGSVDQQDESIDKQDESIDQQDEPEESEPEREEDADEGDGDNGKDSETGSSKKPNHDTEHFYLSTSFANSYLNISIITANCVQIKLIVNENEKKMCGEKSCPWPDKDKALFAFIGFSLILQLVHSLVTLIKVSFKKLMCDRCVPGKDEEVSPENLHEEKKKKTRYERAMEILSIMGVLVALISTISNMIINAFFFDLDIKYSNGTKMYGG